MVSTTIFIIPLRGGLHKDAFGTGPGGAVGKGRQQDLLQMARNGRVSGFSKGSGNFISVYLEGSRVSRHSVTSSTERKQRRLLLMFPLSRGETRKGGTDKCRPLACPHLGTSWCAPRQVDSKTIYSLHTKILSAQQYGAGTCLYAASRRSWTSIGVRTPRPRWRRRKL